MNDTIEMEISIPCDDDGYVLLQCEHCGILFKLTPNDIEDDSILHIFCPSCGLVSENYLTEEVLKIALNMMENYAVDIIYDAFKQHERINRNKMIRYKTGKKPQRQSEDPIRSGIEAMEIVSIPCCKRTAKIKPLLKMTGCYCPFCGVKSYELE